MEYGVKGGLGLCCLVVHLLQVVSGSIPPQQTSRVPSRIVEKTGAEIRIPCPLSSSVPMYFRWYKDKVEIDDSFIRYEIGKQSLKIHQAVTEDGGHFECKGTNGFGKKQLNFTLIMVEDNNTTMTAEEILESRSPGRKPEFVHAEKMSNLVEKPEGAVVKLRCKAHGKPRPKVTWYRDGHKLVDGYSGLIEMYKWTLTIRSLKRENSGNYMCKVSNSAGSTNYTYSLTVIERTRMKPIFISPHPMNSTVAAGQTASFQCIVKSELQPHIQWLKKISASNDLYATRYMVNKTDGIIEVNQEKYVVLKSGEVLAKKDGSYLNKLTISNVRFEHAGMYVCLGTNIMGFTFKQAFLTVTGDPSNESMDRQAGNQGGGQDDLHLTLIICLPIAGAVTIIAVIVVLKHKCERKPNKRPAQRFPQAQKQQAQHQQDQEQFRTLHNFQPPPPGSGGFQQQHHGGQLAPHNNQQMTPSHPMINHHYNPDLVSHSSEMSSIPHRMYSPQQRTIYGEC